MSNNLYYELEKFLIIHVAVRQLRYDNLVSNLRYCRHNSFDNTVKVFVWLNLIFIEKFWFSPIAARFLIVLYWMATII